MARKRTKIAAAACVVLLLAAVLGLMEVGLPRAGAATRTTTLTSVVPDEVLASGRSHYMRVEADTTGHVAYCAQGWLLPAEKGQKVTYYGNPGIPELDYVLYHGYDGEMVKSLYGLSAKKSESATAVAVWLAIGEQRPDLLNFTDNINTIHGNKEALARWESQTDQAVKDASWKLYQAGLAYKKNGGGGIEEGCATLWINNTPYGSDGVYEYQSVVTANKKVEIRFDKNSSSSELTENNAAYSLEGAKYDIYRAKDDTRVASITTDKNGEATCTLSPSTKYYAVEKEAPLGYKLNDKAVAFEVGTSTSTVTLKDQPGTVSFTIAKKDSATNGSAQPGCNLEGAEFKLVSLSTAGWSVTGKTDANGVLKIEGIPLGSFQVVETAAPLGYRLDTTVHTYNVDASQLNDQGVVELSPVDDYSETPVAFDIEIAKLKDGEGDESGVATPAKGVVFEITSNTTGEVVGSVTTGEDGFASTDGFWFGEGSRGKDISGALPYDKAGYTIKEDPDTTPKGFKTAGSWSIVPEQIENGLTLRYIVNNKEISSRVQIVKLDTDSGQAIPLAGFSFQILDKDGKALDQDDWYPSHVELNEFTTDETGTVTLPERLKSGTYRIRETAAAAPYLISKEDVEFTIPDTDDNLEPVTVVKVGDVAATGTATLKKTCSDDGSALAGASYNVIALEDITGADGTVVALDGEVVAQVETNAKGIATVKGLSLGTGTARYAFVEAKAPSGHLLDATPLPFELSYKDQETAVVTAEVAATDAPTNLIISKSVKGSDTPLADAHFLLWNKDDEQTLDARGGFGAAMVRVADQGQVKVSLEPEVSSAVVAVDALDGARITATGTDGESVDLSGETLLAAGTYEIDVDYEGETLKLDNLDSIELKAGKRYELSISKGIFGYSSSLKQEEEPWGSIELAYDAEQAAHCSDSVPAGTYHVVVNGKTMGTLNVVQGSTACATAEEDALSPVPVFLKEDGNSYDLVTGKDGTASIDHLATGSYLVAEVDAPDGYLVDSRHFGIDVDEAGLINGEKVFTLDLEDDYTKVEISKRDADTEEVLAGAVLQITDKKDRVVASWTSSDASKRIDALAPGTYTLTELASPETHDVASPIQFTVEETGEIQTVVLYDEPIEISGEIDKRQEIAQPTAQDTLADESKSNAKVKASDDGSFEYSVDFRSTSSTWVDEFTVEDSIAGAQQGLAVLCGLTTPRVAGDYDGKMNIWYYTNLDSAAGEVNDSANATLSDGHVNPWLSQECNANVLGDDGRALDYTGWRLWAVDVSTTRATELSVDSLDLDEGEFVCAIRLEYGRVEAGFASRHTGWERDLLKDEHDDVDEVEGSHKESFEVEGGSKVNYAPLVLQMKVRDSYRSGAELRNDAAVYLYRNGGGDKLEDQDDDHVIQQPKTASKELAQTGTLSPSIVVAVLGCASATAWALMKYRSSKTNVGKELR